jgi:hypothetical protein
MTIVYLVGRMWTVLSHVSVGGKGSRGHAPANPAAREGSIYRGACRCSMRAHSARAALAPPPYAIAPACTSRILQRGAQAVAT